MPRIQPARPGLVFAVSFMLCAALATALAAYAPEPFLDVWLRITIVSTKAIGFLLGLSVTSKADLMTVNGFAMRIITQCTALHYVLILASGILLYTRHSIAYRIGGVIISIPLIIIANAIRLLVTGVAGSISRDLFEIVHDYLWVAAFGMLILGIWVVWAEKRVRLTYAEIRQGTLTMLACTAAYALLLAARPLYGELMARLGSPLFRVFIDEPQARIDFDGALMQYRYSGSSLSANFMPDLMVTALFIGLMLTMNARWQIKLKCCLAGLLIIPAVTMALVACGGCLAVSSGKELALVFLWTGHGILLSLSMCLWWIMQKTERSNSG